MIVKKQKKAKKRWSIRKMLGLMTMMLALCSVLAVAVSADEPVAYAEAGASMSDLVGEMFSTFTTVIENLASGLKSSFLNLIYVDPSAASPVFSPLVIFLFVMAGIGLAMGILYKIFGLIQRRG